MTRSQTKTFSDENVELPRNSQHEVDECSSHIGSGLESSQQQTGIQSPVAVPDSPDHEEASPAIQPQTVSDSLMSTPCFNDSEDKQTHTDSLLVLDYNVDCLPEELIQSPEIDHQFEIYSDSLEKVNTSGNSATCKLTNIDNSNINAVLPQEYMEPQFPTGSVCCRDCGSSLGSRVWVHCTVCDFQQCTYCMTRTPHSDHLDLVKLVYP